MEGKSLGQIQGFVRLHTQITLTSAKYGFRDNDYRDFVQATTASESLSMSVSISINIVFS